MAVPAQGTPANSFTAGARRTPPNHQCFVCWPHSNSSPLHSWKQPLWLICRGTSTPRRNYHGKYPPFLLTPGEDPACRFGIVPRQPWAASPAVFTCSFLMQVLQIPATLQYPCSTFQPASPLTCFVRRFVSKCEMALAVPQAEEGKAGRCKTFIRCLIWSTPIDEAEKQLLMLTLYQHSTGCCSFPAVVPLKVLLETNTSSLLFFTN